MIFALDPIKLMMAVLMIGAIVGTALFVLTKALGHAMSGILNRSRKNKGVQHESSNS